MLNGSNFSRLYDLTGRFLSLVCLGDNVVRKKDLLSDFYYLQGSVDALYLDSVGDDSFRFLVVLLDNCVREEVRRIKGGMNHAKGTKATR